MAHPKYAPKLHLVGDDVIITLDGNDPRDTAGERVRPNRDWRPDTLRFSVTRGGTFRLASKVKVSPNQRIEPMLDENGAKVPNPNFEKPIPGDSWGRHDHQRWMTEVVEDEPSARASYDVDGTWWRRHGVTRVTL